MEEIVVWRQLVLREARLAPLDQRLAIHFPGRQPQEFELIPPGALGSVSRPKQSAMLDDASPIDLRVHRGRCFVFEIRWSVHGAKVALCDTVSHATHLIGPDMTLPTPNAINLLPAVEFCWIDSCAQVQTYRLYLGISIDSYPVKTPLLFLVRYQGFTTGVEKSVLWLSSVAE